MAMEGYKTLTEAVAMALKVCSSWVGEETEELYGAKDMAYIAQITDIESPNTSKEMFYVVFPDGEIGLLCTYDRSIRRLFIPTDSDFVPSARMMLKGKDDMIPDDAMPRSVPFRAAPPEDRQADTSVPGSGTRPKRDYYYCMYCGAKIESRFKYCTKCGKKSR